MTLQNEHLHGGDPESTFKRLGIPRHKIVDFSVNVSPLGPPRSIFKQWHFLSGEILRYPSVNGNGVVNFYTWKYQLEADMVLPGNGSTECIYLVPRVLGFKNVAVITPSFHDYQRACSVNNSEIVNIPLLPANDFRAPSTDSLRKILPKVDALMLGNPNNPTNTLFDRDQIIDLAKTFPDKYFLVDEAFIQFLDDFEGTSLIHPDLIQRNILVFHSLTKFYDIPGLRLGAVISHPDTIDRLKRCKEPWTVNGIAEKVAQMLVECEDYEQQLRKFINKERGRFFQELEGLDGLNLFNSNANFVFAQWNASSDLDDLIKILLSNGFYIRDCRNFVGLEDNYFRFAILKAQENIQLIKLISKSLNR